MSDHLLDGPSLSVKHLLPRELELPVLAAGALQPAARQVFIEQQLCVTPWLFSHWNQTASPPLWGLPWEGWVDSMRVNGEGAAEACDG